MPSAPAVEIRIPEGERGHANKTPKQFFLSKLKTLPRGRGKGRKGVEVGKVRPITQMLGLPVPPLIKLLCWLNFLRDATYVERNRIIVTFCHTAKGAVVSPQKATIII
jgi:hypothetical protein